MALPCAIAIDAEEAEVGTVVAATTTVGHRDYGIMRRRLST